MHMPSRSGTQYKLFDAPLSLPNGLLYHPNFITPDEEELLISFIQAVPLRHPTDGPEDAYFAKRRIINFGWKYDFEHNRLIPGPPLPKFLQRFARRIEKWMDLPRGSVVEALVNEYTPGSALGWHKDTETFEHIIGISLTGWARMRFRPIAKVNDPKKVVSLELEPCSAYLMQNAVRHNWQHSVAKTKTLRYSITFRTLPRNYARGAYPG